MRRQLELLRRISGLLVDDLNRTLSADWACSVDDDYVLTLQNAERLEAVLLESHVAVDNWPEAAWSKENAETTLEDDAAEMLCEEVAEILRVWDIEWPICSAHGQPMGCCSSVWFCNGPPYHDVALVGQLEAG